MTTDAFTQTLPNGRHVVMRQSGSELACAVDGHGSARLQIASGSDDAMALQLSDVGLADSDAAASVLGMALNALFESRPRLRRIAVGLGARTDLCTPLRNLGIAVPTQDGPASVLSRRGMLRQMPEWFMPQPHVHPFPLIYTMTDGKRHPLRPGTASGEVYRRYDPQLATTIAFKTAEPDADLDIFHAWHNNPRVSAFWELAGSKDMHREYLQKVTNDAHVHPVFGCFDGEPFGYFEIYWAKEDRIAPYYDVDDYDRGVHMLVGDERFRGPHRVAAWLPSLAHYMLLDDPRTRTVVAEPRADNGKMIAYMRQAGFYKTKEFDFPHKRAAMMMLSREAFFDQFCV